MVKKFWHENFYVTFQGTPDKIPGNTGSIELEDGVLPNLKYYIKHSREIMVLATDW